MSTPAKKTAAKKAPAKKAAPTKAAGPAAGALRSGIALAATAALTARITRLENDNEQLRADLDQTRWCFMELLHHLTVAQKVAQLQQLAQAQQQLAADPDVQRMLQAQQGVQPGA